MMIILMILNDNLRAFYAKQNVCKVEQDSIYNLWMHIMLVNAP